MPKNPNDREAPITDARGLMADELTDHEGRKIRDLDRVGAMTPDTDSEEGAKRREKRDIESDDEERDEEDRAEEDRAEARRDDDLDDDDPTIEAPSVVDRDEEDRPDDEPR